MNEPEQPAGRACPQCGETLNRWPTLETSGYLSTCPNCGFERMDEPAPAGESKSPKADSEQTRRMRDLVSEESSTATWPEELLEGLPAEARELLGSKIKKDEHKELPTEMEGGPPADGERRQCPSCQAVLPVGQQRCQWCGHTLRDSGPPMQRS